MPTIYDLKPRFQALLRPITARLAAAGVTANQVTVAALLLSVAVGLAIVLWPAARWPYLLLPLVLFVRMALNAIDGMLAREHDMRSHLGAVLNELGDVVSDIALYAPLASLPEVRGVWLGGFLLLMVISEMSGVIAVQIGASRRYDGPLGKSDRAFVIGLVGLLLGLGLAAGAWLNWVVAVLSVLAAVTVVNRARAALREVAA
ncbi:MAG: CDP-alcohol phosphatidyltransferase family protein [Methylococcaceae bacterium]|nr:CDP-alcohol phosphatidyltransferase family protein [Methylococcaceae bacterium]